MNITLLRLKYVQNLYCTGGRRWNTMHDEDISLCYQCIDQSLLLSGRFFKSVNSAGKSVAATLKMNQ